MTRTAPIGGFGGRTADAVFGRTAGGWVRRLDSTVAFRLALVTVAAALLIADTANRGLRVKWDGDTFFILRMALDGPLVFMSPTAPFLFPDVAVLSLAGVATQDPFDLGIMGQVGLALLTLGLLAACVGGTLAVTLLGLLWILGPVQTAPSYHAGVVALTCLLILAERIGGGGLRRAAGSVGVACDPFLAFVYLVDELRYRTLGAGRDAPAGPSTALAFAVSVAAGLAVAVFFSLKVPQYVYFAAVFALFAGSVVAGRAVVRAIVARLTGHSTNVDTLFLVALASGLLAVAAGARIAGDGQIGRYTAAVAVGAAAVALVALPRVRALPWRPSMVAIGLSAVIAATLFAIPDSRADYRAVRDRFDCLERALAVRDIDRVVTDYWTNQSLATLPPARVRSAQIDLVRSGHFLWNLDLRELALTASHAVRDDQRCRTRYAPGRETYAYFCAFEGNIPVDAGSVETLCGDFTLFRLRRDHPDDPIVQDPGIAIPALRWTVFRTRLDQNIRRLTGHIGMRDAP
ncbi:MAG: hypothetical protein RID91_09870 [Azospirillaceae bacterium]